MNRLSLRVVRLERSLHGRRCWWEGRPLREWPDHALHALLGEGEGWPRDYAPSDDVLRAAMADYDDVEDGGDAV